ncbi:MAG: magnesium transporter [Bacilli bacterium]
MTTNNNYEEKPNKELEEKKKEVAFEETGPDIYISQEIDDKENENDFYHLQDLIKTKQVDKLRTFISESDPIDIAYLVNDISDDEELVYLFKVVPSAYMAPVFSYLTSQQQVKIVNAFNNVQVQALIANMSNDDLADFVEELPSNLVSKVLANTTPEDRKHINNLLNYKEDSAGSIMTTEYVSIKEEFTCEEAYDHIKNVGKDAETIITTYLVDKTRKLVGSLSLQDLVFAQKNKLVTEISDNSCTSCFVDTDEEEVARLMKKYDLNVIPVVDTESRIVGIITVDDIMDVIEKEQTEDLSRMAGMAITEGNYIKTSAFKLAKARIPWLLVLMISATFTGLIISSFEGLLSVLPVLTAFIPMLMDTGGNAGGQTTTVVTRALALGQISTKDYLKVLLKEFLVSLIVGSCLAIVNFCWIYFEISVGLISYKPVSGDPVWLLALLVSLTAFMVVVISKTLGASLPLFAKKIHLDPAIMAGPVITTIVDACALIIYFLFAKLILGI